MVFRSVPLLRLSISANFFEKIYPQLRCVYSGDRPHPVQFMQKQAGGSAMHSGDLGINRKAAQLAEAERRVPEVNALIDRQRQLIEDLELHGVDLTSAKIVLDSLLVSLSLYVQDRHRLRAALNGGWAQATAA